MVTLSKKAIWSLPVMIIVLLATLVAIQPTLAAAHTPPSSGSYYIADLHVGNLNAPLDFGSGGFSFWTTAEGERSCPAWTIAYYGISEWERRTGQHWPYHWRSYSSVAWEIQVHCWIFDTTQRPTTIRFNDGWIWD